MRRELSDNFCWYNVHYDSLKGAAAWALETLKKHSKARASAQRVSTVGFTYAEPRCLEVDIRMSEL